MSDNQMYTVIIIALISYILGILTAMYKFLRLGAKKSLLPDLSDFCEESPKSKMPEAYCKVRSGAGQSLKGRTKRGGQIMKLADILVCVWIREIPSIRPRCF